MGFTTWLEMCGNGVLTGILQHITQFLHLTIQPGLPAAPAGYDGAAIGTALLTTFVQLFVTPATHPTAAHT